MGNTEQGGGFVPLPTVEEIVEWLWLDLIEVRVAKGEAEAYRLARQGARADRRVRACRRCGLSLVPPHLREEMLKGELGGREFWDTHLHLPLAKVVLEGLENLEADRALNEHELNHGEKVPGCSYCEEPS